MLGAIVGDIAETVQENSIFSDGTVMTCAVAEAVMNGGSRDDFINSMKKYGRMYPNVTYGDRFKAWIKSEKRRPYKSFGNGSAKRISPCAWAMKCSFSANTGLWPSRGRDLARLSARVTHNHPEGIKGAMATADAIFMARYYFGGYYGNYELPINDKPEECKQHIKEHIEREYGYDLSWTIEKNSHSYTLNTTCQETVPLAIIAFLESTDFEDAIRKAISLGGKKHGLATITGSIAEAAYGIPDWIKEKAYSCLDEPLKKILRRWKKFKFL